MLSEVDSVFVAILFSEFYTVRFFDYIARTGSMEPALIILMYVCVFHAFANYFSHSRSCMQRICVLYIMTTVLNAVILLKS